MRALEIGIAGAGPAGLAAALFLSRAGHRVRLFERFDTPRPVGSGLLMQPTGLGVLAALGLDAELRGLGMRVDRLFGTEAGSGRTVLDVHYKPLGEDVHGVGVHRAALFGLLHRAVLRAGIEIVHGSAIDGYQRDGGRGWLTHPNGRHGPFDLVIDASGARSVLRAHARWPMVPRPLAYGAIWATVPWVDDAFDRRVLMQRYRKSSIMVGVLPVGRQAPEGEDQAALFWSLKPDLYDAVRARGIAAWHDEVLAIWPELSVHIRHLPDFDRLSLARYAHGTLRMPAGEGIAFIGDSAHTTSPQLGQGANMALLDAAALSAAIAVGEPLEDALSRYCRMRRWHVRIYQLASLGLTPLYQSDGNLAPLLRDMLLTGIAKLPPFPWLLASLVAGGWLAGRPTDGLRGAAIVP